MQHKHSYDYNTLYIYIELTFSPSRRPSHSLFGLKWDIPVLNCEIKINIQENVQKDTNSELLLQTFHYL